MFRKIAQRVQNYVSPFHQKVLRFNYDIPLPLLKTALTVAFAHFHKSELCVADDFFECSSQLVGEFCVAPVEQLIDGLQMLVRENDMIKTGVFDREMSFYLRLYVEPESEVDAGGVQCGNFELYARDEDLQEIVSRMREAVPAHILLDGAKRYLDEIYYYG